MSAPDNDRIVVRTLPTSPAFAPTLYPNKLNPGIPLNGHERSNRSRSASGGGCVWHSDASPASAAVGSEPRCRGSDTSSSGSAPDSGPVGDEKPPVPRIAVPTLHPDDSVSSSSTGLSLDHVFSFQVNRYSPRRLADADVPSFFFVLGCVLPAEGSPEFKNSERLQTSVVSRTHYKKHNSFLASLSKDFTTDLRPAGSFLPTLVRPTSASLPSLFAPTLNSR